MSENPYQSPTDGTSADRPAMTWGKGILIVFGTTTIGGLGGMAIGALLGLFLPSYYRSVFAGGTAPGFDPVAVGIGQGLTQGVTLGCLIGMVLVAAIIWYKTRRPPP